MTKQRREPYAKLYASWHSHPRTGPLSLAAAGLEAKMMSWCVAHGTDGHVPRDCVATAAPSAKSKELAAALGELVARGVLTEHPEGYTIRDFLDANISKERDEKRRADQVERQNRSRGHASVTRDNPAGAKSVTRDGSVSHTPSLDHDHDHDHLTRKGDLEQVGPRTPVAEVAPPSRSRDADAIRAGFARAYVEASTSPPPVTKHVDGKPWHELVDFGRIEAERGGLTLDDVGHRLGQGALRRKRFSFTWLVENPREFFAAAPASTLGGGESTADLVRDLTSDDRSRA